MILSLGSIGNSSVFHLNSPWLLKHILRSGDKLLMIEGQGEILAKAREARAAKKAAVPAVKVKVPVPVVKAKVAVPVVKETASVSAKVQETKIPAKTKKPVTGKL
jgi:hypothetical protein